MTKQYQKMVFRSKEKRHHIKLIKNKFLAMTKATDILERIKNDIVLF